MVKWDWVTTTGAVRFSIQIINADAFEKLLVKLLITCQTYGTAIEKLYPLSKVSEETTTFNYCISSELQI